MNRTLKVILLVFITAFVMIGCKNENEKLLYLNDIYEINDGDSLKNLSIMTFPNSEAKSTEIELNDEIIRNVYNFILKMKVREVEPQEMTLHKSDPKYLIYFTVKKDGENMSFNIALGDSYIDFSLSDDAMLYQHDISEMDYKELIDIIEKRQ